MLSSYQLDMIFLHTFEVNGILQIDKQKKAINLNEIIQNKMIINNNKNKHKLDDK